MCVELGMVAASWLCRVKRAGAEVEGMTEGEILGLTALSC